MPPPHVKGLGPRGFLTDEEKQNRPKITGSLIRRILSYLKPYWFQFLLEVRLKTFAGFTAQIIQHEVDHCDGILI